jgi:hypothetical protein
MHVDQTSGIQAPEVTNTLSIGLMYNMEHKIFLPAFERCVTMLNMNFGQKSIKGKWSCGLRIACLDALCPLRLLFHDEKHDESEPIAFMLL